MKEKWIQNYIWVVNTVFKNYVMCMSICLHICLCTMYVCAYCLGDQKRTLGSLELELERVVRCFVGAEN